MDLDFSLYFYAYTDAETPDDAAPQPERADWQGGYVHVSFVRSFVHVDSLST